MVEVLPWNVVIVVEVAVVSDLDTSVLNVDLDVDINEVVVLGFVTFVTATNDVTGDVGTDVVIEVIANSAVINLAAGVDLDSIFVSSVVTASPKNS